MAYQFILPLYVRLPDDRAIYFPYQGTMVSVRARRVKGEQIHSYAENDYEWLTNDDGAGTWYQIRAVAGGESIPFREVLIPSEPGIPARGRRDQAVFSVLEVVFEFEGEDAEQVAGDDVRDWVQNVLSRFFDWYRLVSDDVGLHAGEISSSAVVQIYTATEYDFGPEGTEASFRRDGRILNWDRPDELGITRREIPEEAVRALALGLEADQEVDLHVRILLDAKEMSFNYSDHNLAIVLIENAFEVFLQNLLISECQVRGITELELRGELRSLSDAIADGSLRSDLLRNYPNQICGVNLRSLPSYDGWRSNTYEPRNRIVHAGSRGFEAPDAKAAFEAADRFSGEISQAMQAA